MAQSGRYPDDWDERRSRVYERDDYTCQNCGVQGGPHGAVELHADHITPISKRGSHRLDNLQTLCRTCHDYKTVRDTGEGLQQTPELSNTRVDAGPAGTASTRTGPLPVDSAGGTDGGSHRVPGPNDYDVVNSRRWIYRIASAVASGVALPFIFLLPSPTGYRVALGLFAVIAVIGVRLGHRRRGEPDTRRCPSCGRQLLETDVDQLWYCTTEDAEFKDTGSELVDGFQHRPFDTVFRPIPTLYRRFSFTLWGIFVAGLTLGIIRHVVLNVI